MALTLTDSDIAASTFEDAAPLRALCQAVAERAAAVDYVPLCGRDFPCPGAPPRISPLRALVTDVWHLAALYADLGRDYALGSFGTQSSSMPLVHTDAGEGPQDPTDGYRAALGFPRPLRENPALLAAHPLWDSPAALQTFSEDAFETCYKNVLVSCRHWLAAMRYVPAAPWTFTHGLSVAQFNTNETAATISVQRPTNETGIVSLDGRVGTHPACEYSAYYSGSTDTGTAIFSYYTYSPLDFFVWNPAPFAAYVRWVPCRGENGKVLPCIRTEAETLEDAEEFTGHGELSERYMIHGTWVDTERQTWTVAFDANVGNNVKHISGVRNIYTADGILWRAEPIAQDVAPYLVHFDSTRRIERNYYGWKTPNPFYNRMPPDDGSVHPENTTDEYLPVALFSHDVITGPAYPHIKHTPFGEWTGNSNLPVHDLQFVPDIDVTSIIPGPNAHDKIEYALTTRVLPVFDYGPAFGVAEIPVTLESERRRAAEWRLRT